MDDAVVGAAARRAIGSAAALSVFAGVFLFLSLAGSAIVAIIGFTPQCPLGQENCLSSQRSGNGSLIIAGLAGALMSALFFFLLRTIAARVELAGHLALAQVRSPASGQGSPAPTQWADAPQASPVSGIEKPEFHRVGCPTCGSRRVRRGSCERCGAEAVDFDNREGWYADPAGEDRERYFDGEDWTPEVRATTRHTLGDWDRSGPQWLVDPDDISRDRYWDGTDWTSRVCDAWGDDEEIVPLR